MAFRRRSPVGDIVIAEPGALIGFAGPRVIEQTVRETLPEGFQRAEFLMTKGAVDMIVDRRQLRDQLANLMTLLLRLPAPSWSSDKKSPQHDDSCRSPHGLSDIQRACLHKTK